MSKFKQDFRERDSHILRNPKYMWPDDEGCEPQQRLVELALETDFFETDGGASLESFAEEFGRLVADGYHETLLVSIASLPAEEFPDMTLGALLSFILHQQDCDTLLLNPRKGSFNDSFPLHVAIEGTNIEFLDCILEISDDPEVDIQLSKALEVPNQSNQNCLHMAIEKRLPCVERMIQKCSATALKAAESRRHQTPLHLAMGKDSMPWPSRKQPLPTKKGENNPNTSKARSTRHKRLDSSKQGDAPLDGRASSIFTGRFNIDGIMDTMIKAAGSDTQFLVDLLTATNKYGLSPFQVRQQKVERLKGQIKTQKDRAEKLGSAGNASQSMSTLSQNQKVLADEEDYLNRFKTRIFDSLSEVSHIRRALFGTEGSERELCLDMSDFNQSSHDFRGFVDELTRIAGREIIEFESTLFYVYLPDLNIIKSNCPHDGVYKLFEWLSETKGVTTIRNLNIPDNTAIPMSDVLVAEGILDRFSVHRFEWRKLDINLDILTTSKYASDLQDLTLYSSGNWSVLYHWASKDGLGKLRGLRKLRIEIIQANPEDLSCAQTRHEKNNIIYKERMDSLLKEISDDWKFERVQYQVVPNTKWHFPALQFRDNSEPFIPDLQFFPPISKCRNYLLNLNNLKDPTSSQYYERFQSLCNLVPGKPDRRIKVAIIDNGADKIRTSLKDHIERGVSFVTADLENEDRVLPWWMVADPHGTQMASLVKKVNPFARLYIARVGKGRRDIVPENAAKAIRWAVEQKVDIISISWVTKKNSAALEEAIREAKKDNRRILIFCSTADQGVYSREVWPAAYSETVSVAATDRYGHMMPTTSGGVNILVPGEQIKADGPSYMDDYTEGTLSGSSVATALASGIASLALLLLQTFNCVSSQALKDLCDNNLQEVFEKLSSGGSYGIDISKLFPEDTSKLPEMWELKNFLPQKKS